MNTELTWTGSPDDQTCRINDYVLRVEKVDKWWWWGCSLGGWINHSGIWCTKRTVNKAKAAAINAMKEHKDGSR